MRTGAVILLKKSEMAKGDLNNLMYRHLTAMAVSAEIGSTTQPLGRASKYWSPSSQCGLFTRKSLCRDFPIASTLTYRRHHASSPVQSLALKLSS